jgi:hypothetical protein
VRKGKERGSSSGGSFCLYFDVDRSEGDLIRQFVCSRWIRELERVFQGAIKFDYIVSSLGWLDW